MDDTVHDTDAAGNMGEGYCAPHIQNGSCARGAAESELHTECGCLHPGIVRLGQLPWTSLEKAHQGWKADCVIPWTARDKRLLPATRHGTRRGARRFFVLQQGDCGFARLDSRSLFGVTPACTILKRHSRRKDARHSIRCTSRPSLTCYVDSARFAVSCSLRHRCTERGQQPCWNNPTHCRTMPQASRTSR